MKSILVEVSLSVNVAIRQLLVVLSLLTTIRSLYCPGDAVLTLQLIALGVHLYPLPNELLILTVPIISTILPLLSTKATPA